VETADASVDVLVVGAGPTGLTLASRLATYGVSVRLVDLKAGPVAESRALGVQPRTLEVLRGRVTDELLERGNPAVELRWHAGDRVTALPMFDMSMDDTAYPFLLFLSQAETEAVMVEHLRQQGVDVEWQTRFVGQVDRRTDHSVACELLDADGHRHTLLARYVVGCDGAHSTVREVAGIRFTGARYPQTFLLADLDAEGLEPDAAHAWLSGDGPVLFFPLARPAAWRLLTARPQHDGHPRAGDGATATAPVTPAELQGVVDAATGSRVRLGPPLWATAFKIHHRHASTYRAGRLFLAGDAAHIHSPAGAQGMNTGIQDAVNLAWKLALVCTGRSPERLLDTYDAERRPVGEFVLRFTDRAFTAATSSAPAVRFVREHVAPRALTLVARLPGLRGVAFRTVSELGIRYPDTLDGTGAGPVQRRRSPRPAPGERLPDLRVLDAGRASWLHDHLTGTGFHLLLCGAGWDETALDELATRYAGLLTVVRLARPRTHPGEGSLVAVDGAGWRRLGVAGAGHLLVRPDGHVAHRHEGTDVAGVAGFLGRWLGG
jgi:2-polyprenyl-6-methoxyphenol hydroxylase-like FAD-dependent oxidoreductase